MRQETKRAFGAASLGLVTVCVVAAVVVAVIYAIGGVLYVLFLSGAQWG